MLTTSRDAGEAVFSSEAWSPLPNTQNSFLAAAELMVVCFLEAGREGLSEPEVLLHESGLLRRIPF